MEFHSMQVSPGHLARASASAAGRGRRGAACGPRPDGCGGDSPSGPRRKRCQHRRRQRPGGQWRRPALPERLSRTAAAATAQAARGGSGGGAASATAGSGLAAAAAAAGALILLPLKPPAHSESGASK